MSKACKILKGTCGACGGGGDRPTPVDDVELKDLKDVSIHTPVDGQTLKYDASTGKWRNEKDEVILNMEEINDVVTHELEDWDILIYDKATMKWRNGAVVTSFAELDDVDLNGLEDGDIIRYDAESSKFVPAGLEVKQKIEDLEDVEYQDIQDGDILRYDAEVEKWITAPIEDLTEIVTEWEDELSDEKVPSEKLVKGELDNRLLQVDELPTDAVGGTIVQLKEDGKVYIANEDWVFEETVKELPFVLDDIEDGNVLKYDAETDTFIPSIDADSIFLTQDEYDALTPEQKGNGNTYTIIGETEDRMISSTEIEYRDETLNVILDRIEGDESVEGSIKYQVSRMNNLKKEVVEELPEAEDADPTILYLKKAEGEENIYEMYTLVEEEWESVLKMIGTTETNLEDYYTKDETDEILEDYQYKVLDTDSVESIDVIETRVIPTSKNIIDGSISTENWWYYWTAGEILEQSRALITDFMPIKPLTTYTFSWDSQISYGRRISLFNKDKEFIVQPYSLNTVGAHQGTFKTPLDAYYFTLSTVSEETFDAGKYQLEEGDTVTEYSNEYSKESKSFKNSKLNAKLQYDLDDEDISLIVWAYYDGSNVKIWDVFNWTSKWHDTFDAWRTPIKKWETIRLVTSWWQNGRAYIVTWEWNKVLEIAWPSITFTDAEPFIYTAVEDGYIWGTTQKLMKDYLRVSMTETPKTIMKRVETVEDKIDKFSNPIIWPKIYNPKINFDKEELRIFDIGNSFTEDPTSYLTDLITYLWVDTSKMSFSRAIRGWAFYKNRVDVYNNKDTSSYSVGKLFGWLTETFNGTAAAGNGEKFRRALSEHKFDIVVIHQVSTYSNDYTWWEGTGANWYLKELIRIIKLYQPQAAIAFLMVHSSPRDNSNTQLRWKQIADSAKWMSLNYWCDMIIPYGTAVENLRLYVWDAAAHKLTRDWHHIADGLCRYTANCAYYESLLAPYFKKSVYKSWWTYKPVTAPSWYESDTIQITPENALIGQMAAMLAIGDRYTITNPDWLNINTDYEEVKFSRPEVEA